MCIHILSFSNMLTQSDLQKIKSLLRQTNAPNINKDFKKLATKEDLKNFVTKNELKNMAKDVINLIGAFDNGLKIEIETAKNELREEIKSVKTELKEDIHSLDNEIKSVKTELNEKMDIMIEQMSKVEKNTDMIPSLKETINNHEVRIKKLEIKNTFAL